MIHIYETELLLHSDLPLATAGAAATADTIAEFFDFEAEFFVFFSKVA